jgi:uncharacterized protein (TIGR00725 family)
VRGRPYVAVVGASEATPELSALADEVGRRLAEAGAVLVCGGLGGVMEAAARGCSGAGGTSVGILPGDDRGDANPHVSVAIATGMGETRNALVVRAADAVIAVGGGFGTLSEMALAARTGTPVVGLRTWSMGRDGMGDPVVHVADANDAVATALQLATPTS